MFGVSGKAIMGHMKSACILFESGNETFCLYGKRTIQHRNAKWSDSTDDFRFQWDRGLLWENKSVSKNQLPWYPGSIDEVSEKLRKPYSLFRSDLWST